MSTKPEQIDLNSDAVCIDRENDANEVNIADEAAPGRGLGVSVPETLEESVCGGQGQGERQMVDTFRDFRGAGASESAGGVDENVKSLTVDRLGKEEKMDCVDRRIDLEADVMSVDKGADETVGGFGADGGSCDSVSKEGSSGGLENQAMEMDRNTQAEINENQMTGIQGSGKRVCRNAGYGPTMSTDLDVSADANAKSTSAKPEFLVADLVWGKVRSHPWWPGQIFEPSAASAKAKKYFKKGFYLIAYFGDQTFAWNEASRIKPFRSHFLDMEKQSSLEDFHYAIDCALEEVSRRIEFGLMCPCIPKDIYARVKTQMIVNAGIREESCRREGGDRFSTAASFEPLQLVEFIKDLAQSPCYSGINRLQFVTSQAQLLAFNRWKGYPQLPEFTFLVGVLNDDAQIPLFEEVKQCCEAIENADSKLDVDDRVSSGDGKVENKGGSSHKRKNTYNDDLSSCKKEKCLSELISETLLNMQNGRREVDDTAGGKSDFASPGRKRKAVDSGSDDSVVKNRSNVATGSASKSQQSKQTFRVGASILRVANQLNGSNSILKLDDNTRKTLIKNKCEGNFRPGKSPQENSSPDEMLSQLCFAARNPNKHYNFLTSMVGFFTELRNSVCMEQNSSEKLEESMELGDSFWTDRTFKCLPEEQLRPDNQNQAGEVEPEAPDEKDISTAEKQPSVEHSSNMDSEQKPDDRNPEMEAEKPVELLDESCNKDVSDFTPTALVLKFSDLASVPSEDNLNKIFSRYGSLIVSGTEVLKKSSQAKVVFGKRADAETAFSSAGKYSIFGPSLVSYRLKYMPEKPSKATPGKRSRKDVKSGVEGES